jgi:hypothetical protein
MSSTFLRRVGLSTFRATARTTKRSYSVDKDVWTSLRKDLSGSVDESELKEYDKLFQDLPENELNEIRERLSKSLVLNAVSEGTSSFADRMIRKEEEASEEESEIFGKYLLAFLKDEQSAVLEGKYDDIDLKAELETFGVTSEKPILMFHEAAQSMLKSDEMQEHFNDWSERAESMLQSQGLDEKASLSEMAEVLRKQGMLNEISPFRGEDPLSSESRPGFRQSLIDMANRLLGSSDDDNDNKEGEEERELSDQAKLSTFLRFTQSELYQNAMSVLEKKLKGNNDAHLEFQKILMSGDQEKLKEFLGSDVLKTLESIAEKDSEALEAEVAELKRSSEPSKQEEEHKDPHQKLTEEEFAELTEEEKDSRMMDTSYFWSEWNKWNEEKGRSKVDKDDAASWLRVVEDAEHETENDPDADHIQKHPLDIGDAWISVTPETFSRRTLRRIFQLYDDVVEQSREIQEKTPADDLLALNAQPTEFVGDAPLRYSYNHYMYVKSHDLEQHPGEETVKLKVNLKRMALSSSESSVMKHIMGRRFDPASGDITITSRKFSERLHNRIHTRLILDRAVQEAKRIVAADHDGDDDVAAA